MYNFLLDGRPESRVSRPSAAEYPKGLLGRRSVKPASLEIGGVPPVQE